jgi:hypothetical protein
VVEGINQPTRFGENAQLKVGKLLGMNVLRYAFWRRRWIGVNFAAVADMDIELSFVLMNI